MWAPGLCYDVDGRVAVRIVATDVIPREWTQRIDKLNGVVRLSDYSEDGRAVQISFRSIKDAEDFAALFPSTEPEENMIFRLRKKGYEPLDMGKYKSVTVSQPDKYPDPDKCFPGHSEPFSWKVVISGLASLSPEELQDFRFKSEQTFHGKSLYGYKAGMDQLEYSFDTEDRANRFLYSFDKKQRVE